MEPRPVLATGGLVLTSILALSAVLELGVRVFGDPSGGHADILAQSAQARAMSVHVKSDDPELIYVARPWYATNGVRISEAHGILRSTDVGERKPRGRSASPCWGTRSPRPIRCAWEAPRVLRSISSSD